MSSVVFWCSSSMSEVTVSNGGRRNSIIYWICGRAYVKEKVYANYTSLCCRHKQSLFKCPGIQITS